MSPPPGEEDLWKKFLLQSDLFLRFFITETIQAAHKTTAWGHFPTSCKQLTLMRTQAPTFGSRKKFENYRSRIFYHYKLLKMIAFLLEISKTTVCQRCHDFSWVHLEIWRSEVHFWRWGENVPSVERSCFDLRLEFKQFVVCSWIKI